MGKTKNFYIRDFYILEISQSLKTYRQQILEKFFLDMFMLLFNPFQSFFNYPKLKKYHNETSLQLQLELKNIVVTS